MTENNKFKLPRVSAGLESPIKEVSVATSRTPKSRTKVSLPPRFFLYTLDQIATILNVRVESLTASYIYFERRSTYVKKKGQLSARNIAPADQAPDWRVIDTELKRWMRLKGFSYREEGKFYEDEKYSE